MHQRWFLAAIASSFLFVAGNTAVVAQAVRANPAPVQVFVSATAKDGTPAALDPSTLTVLIDKQSAQILSVHPAKDDKLLFAVMVDMSKSEIPQEKGLKDAAVRIFQGLSNENSQGYLVLFSLQAYPSKRPLQPSEAQAALDRIQFEGGTALYDSVAQVCSGVLSRSNNHDTPRRVLIILSDGDDNYSHIVADKMEEEAEREGIAIFSLPNYASDSSPKGMDILRQFAKDTGGTLVLANKLLDGVSPLVSAVEGQLVLSLASAQPSGGELHSLTVKTSEKGISASAPAHILIP